MKTKEKLAKALEEAGAPQRMILKAQIGDYDDYESNSATPIIDLYKDCIAEGLHKFAGRVINGEFDSTKEESDE